MKIDVLLDRVTAEARKVKPARAFRSLLVLPFYGVAWVIGTLWLGVALVGSAVAVGFNDGRTRSVSGR